MNRLGSTLWGYGTGILTAAIYTMGDLGPLWLLLLGGGAIVLFSKLFDIRIMNGVGNE